MKKEYTPFMKRLFGISDLEVTKDSEERKKDFQDYYDRVAKLQEKSIDRFYNSLYEDIKLMDKKGK